jgi:7-alpha-hydroxysteroid dehydrogenase
MSIQQLFSLQDKVAIITGAGKGLGRAIALIFAEAGANVVCAARTMSDLEETCSLAKAFGVKAIPVQCNVVDDKALQNLVDVTMSEFNHIDILVNNAGGAFPRSLSDTDGDTYNKDHHFNVTTALNLSRIALPYLSANNNGCIINITSGAARYISSGFLSYSTAKAALTQMTKLLAAELAPDVRVNAIAPGSIMTDALNQFLDDNSRQKMTDLTPMKSLGESIDIAAAALYLASPACRWVTGKIIEVDGGAENSTWPF